MANETRLTGRETRQLLRRVAEHRGDILPADARRLLIRAGRNASVEVVESRSFIARGALALGAVAALGLVAVLPALFGRIVPAGSPASPVRDLSVTADAERVVLTWTDGGAPRRVIRATSRQELSNPSALTAHSVTGESWVDEEQSAAHIVYYIVE
jgi:hypothetical protein